MQTIIETPEFLVWAKAVWTDEEREDFIDWITDNPQAGDVIPHTTGLRKVRWTRAGMGKRGGARVIYFIQQPHGEILLLLVYAKAKFDNIRPEILKKLKEKYDV